MPAAIPSRLPSLDSHLSQRCTNGPMKGLWNGLLGRGSIRPKLGIPVPWSEVVYPIDEPDAGKSDSRKGFPTFPNLLSIS